MSTDWMAHAACRDIDDPEIFYPLPSQNGNQARAVCARCPVKDQCLQDALDKGDVYGYRGGQSGEERRRVLVGRGRRRNQDAEIRRLHGLGWTTGAISLALGVSSTVVWRANSTPRSGEVA